MSAAEVVEISCGNFERNTAHLTRRNEGDSTVMVHQIRIVCKVALLRGSRQQAFDSDNEGAECLESEFREMSALQCTILNRMTAHEFVSGENDEQAAANITDAVPY